MTVISPFVLYGAEAYLKRLQETMTDSLVNQVIWKEKLGWITNEWGEFTIYVRLYKFARHSTYYYFNSRWLQLEILIIIIF